MRVPVVVEVEFDEDRRLYMPWRMFRGQETVFLRDPRLERHSRVARTVYLHYSALGHDGRYDLMVNLDNRQWLLVNIDEADGLQPSVVADD